MRWHDDRLTLWAFCSWLHETGRVTEVSELLRVMEKPHKWATEYDEWRAEQDEESLESLVDARREATA